MDILTLKYIWNQRHLFLVWIPLKCFFKVVSNFTGKFLFPTKQTLERVKRAVEVEESFLATAREGIELELVIVG